MGRSMRMTTRRFASFASVALVLASLGGCRRQETPGAEPRQAEDVRLIPETMLVRDVVPRSTTLYTLLSGHGLETDGAGRVVDAVRSVFDPRQMRSFQPFLLERTLTTGALRLFEYEIDSESLLRVAPVGLSGPLKAEVLPIPRTLEHHTVAGVIDPQATSLYAAMKAAGEGDDLAIKLAGVFSGEIDFNSEVQLGDRFRLVVERFRRDDGGGSTYGAIQAAEYAPSDGRVLRAIRFAPPDSRPDFNPYYDENGRSLRRFFLKSPLKFEPRITSRFSANRRHPVLHTSRAHRGVDYGAPTGAPVIAVASGTVISVTSDSTNGRMVRIRHASGYETYYLHLSRFAAGMRSGKRVDQEEVIGYVGSSGLSTGPHLHYGLTKNGVFVNPIAEHQRMPPGEPVPPSAMAAFQEVRNRELAALAAVQPADAAPNLARAP